LPERVWIFDTTLRDGEQTPGVALTPEDKLDIAKQLDKLGVDVIEAGFPISSEGEMTAVKKIVAEGLRSEICALARASRKDIDATLLCNVDRVHIFIATSPTHMKKKLKLTQEEVLQKAVESVVYAKEHGVGVEFSAEDATRSSEPFLINAFSAVVDAGADRINVPDTVGFCAPKVMFNLIRGIREKVKAPISVHCHNDLGMAVANSLAAIEAGADQAHVTVNGIGERAGNASLEELAVALQVLYGVKSNIHLGEVFKTSQLVSRLTGVSIPQNKAVVGENAFAHESGIHTHGILRAPSTYEPFRPELVGRRRRLVAGKHAGASGVEAMLKEMALSVSGEELSQILERVKSLGDKGRKVTETDLYSLADSIIGARLHRHDRILLQDLVVVTGNKTTPTAMVKLLVNGQERSSSNFGIGPVDASINAVRNVVKDIVNFQLVEFRLESITGGTNALADVTVKLVSETGRLVSARAVNEDIVMAGVQAIINATNRVLQLVER